VAAPYLAGVQADVRPASRGPGARRARPVGVGRETPGTPNPASHPEQGSAPAAARGAAAAPERAGRLPHARPGRRARPRRAAHGGGRVDAWGAVIVSSGFRDRLRGVMAHRYDA